MGALLSKFFQIVLPIALNWIYSKVSTFIQKLARKKAIEDAVDKEEDNTKNTGRP